MKAIFLGQVAKVRAWKGSRGLTYHINHLGVPYKIENSCTKLYCMPMIIRYVIMHLIYTTSLS